MDNKSASSIQNKVGRGRHRRNVHSIEKAIVFSDKVDNEDKIVHVRGGFILASTVKKKNGEEGLRSLQIALKS